jgi:hypothetical protein
MARRQTAPDGGGPGPRFGAYHRIRFVCEALTLDPHGGPAPRAAAYRGQESGRGSPAGLTPTRGRPPGLPRPSRPTGGRSSTGEG